MDIRITEGITQGCNGNNPIQAGYRQFGWSKQAIAYQFRFTISASNPHLVFGLQVYTSFSQTNATDYYGSWLHTLGFYCNTSGTCAQTYGHNSTGYASFGLGVGFSFSTRQADLYIWGTNPSAFPGTNTGGYANIFCNRWDYVTISLI